MSMAMTTCVACKNNFDITTEDKAFYEKMAPVFGGKKYPLPEPKKCPDCRLTQRVVYRNEQYFYNNKSSFSGDPLIALYSGANPWAKDYKICTYEEFWSDTAWNPMQYGRDFDFSRPFFEQFFELAREIPLVNLVQLNNENSPYSTGTGYCKNCYLINSSENCEDCYYGKLLQSSRSILDSCYVYDSELLYQCFQVKKCYNCRYVSYSQNSYDCYFSENLNSCKNCFLSTNLSNKEYYFLNQPLGKEEYQKKVQALLNGSYAMVEQNLEQLKELRQNRIYKYANVLNCENSSGDFLTNCKNCQNCFDVNDSEDCRYVVVGVHIKDVMDSCNMYLKPELCYETLGTIAIYNVIGSLYVFHAQNILYSQFCYNSNNLFGCVGLKKNQYCILNKQYTQAEYEQLVPKIIEHMHKTGEWGEFFPARFSPFGYNESVAMEYFPLPKEQAIAAGFHWSDYESPKPQVEKILPAAKLPDNIQDIPDDILNWAVECEITKKPFRIIKQELKFYRNHNLPIPRRHPDQRHKDRMELRNPRKLYRRACMKCGKEIQTTFAETRKEMVYCEQCYLQEVY